MKTSTPRRRVSLAAAVALAGGLSMAGMSSASAEVDGNLETKGPLYFCEDGDQKVVVYARTVTATDTIKYASNQGSDTLGEFTPGKNYGYVYSRGDWGGTSTTITFSTVKTKDNVEVAINVPTTCDGLPTSRPDSGWEGTEVAPSAPTTSDEPTSSSSTSTETTTEKPTSTDEPSGPPVETGVVSDGGNGSTLALVGLLTMGVAVTGAAAATRLNKH